FPPGSAERDACIDQAQSVAFACRDSAHEQAGPGFHACRQAFRQCAEACPPNDPPDEGGVRACLKDARHAFRECKADCREEFQLDKDTCLNRDHDCVEACRADRETCREPIVSALRAALDACESTKDAAIANCRLLYPPGSPERDACVDQAQL